MSYTLHSSSASCIIRFYKNPTRWEMSSGYCSYLYIYIYESWRKVILRHYYNVPVTLFPVDMRSSSQAPVKYSKSELQSPVLEGYKQMGNNHIFVIINNHKLNFRHLYAVVDQNHHQMHCYTYLSDNLKIWHIYIRKEKIIFLFSSEIYNERYRLALSRANVLRKNFTTVIYNSPLVKY